MNKVFVYGILMNMFENKKAELQDYEKFWRGHATIRKRKGASVDGQLIEVDDQKLEDFDKIEGVAQGYYHRMRTDNVLVNGEVVIKKGDHTGTLPGNALRKG